MPIGIQNIPMIKGIIFDLDGVLVDAVDWHFKALNRALNLFGYSLDELEHQEKEDLGSQG